MFALRYLAATAVSRSIFRRASFGAGAGGSFLAARTARAAIAAVFARAAIVAVSTAATAAVRSVPRIAFGRWGDRLRFHRVHLLLVEMIRPRDQYAHHLFAELHFALQRGDVVAGGLEEGDHE